MSDLSWCTHCDNAISQYSESLYCSEQCLRADALRNHPLLGYTYPEFENFPKPYDPKQLLYQQKIQQSLSSSFSYNKNNKKSSLPLESSSSSTTKSIQLKSNSSSRSSSISSSTSTSSSTQQQRIIKTTINPLTPYYHSTSSSDSLNTLPSLSSSHSSCHTSPTLSAYDRLPTTTTTTTISLPQFENLPPMIPIKKKPSSVHNNKNNSNNNNKSNIPSCLLIGVTTPTTAVSRYQVFY